MQTEMEALRLRIFVDEQDRWHGKELHGAIVDLVRREGLAGVTVVRGTEGRGRSGMTAVPYIVEIVDAPEQVERILPLVGELVGEGMATVDPVRAICYRQEASREAAAPTAGER